MIGDQVDSCQSLKIDFQSPVVSHVELGVAKLNSVSHHEYLRCAKLVSPLARKLSFKGSKSSGTAAGKETVIIVEPFVEPPENCEDVYEDVMEDKLETSFDTRVEEPKTSGSIGDDESDTSSVSEVGACSEGIDSDQDIDKDKSDIGVTGSGVNTTTVLEVNIVRTDVNDTDLDVDVDKRGTIDKKDIEIQHITEVDLDITKESKVESVQTVQNNSTAVDLLIENSATFDKKKYSEVVADLEFEGVLKMADMEDNKINGDVKMSTANSNTLDGPDDEQCGIFHDNKCHSPPERRESRVTIETDFVSEFLELYESRKLEMSKGIIEEFEGENEIDDDLQEDSSINIDVKETTREEKGTVDSENDERSEDVRDVLNESADVNEDETDVKPLGLRTSLTGRKYYIDEDDVMEHIDVSHLRSEKIVDRISDNDSFELDINADEGEADVTETINEEKVVNVEFERKADRENIEAGQGKIADVSINFRENFEAGQGEFIADEDEVEVEGGRVEIAEDVAEESVDVNDDSGIVDVSIGGMDEVVSEEDSALVEASVNVSEVVESEEEMVQGVELSMGTGTGQGFAAESSAQEQEENAAKFNGNTESKENGLSEEDAVRDPNIFRETREKEEIHFAEMNNVRQKFESGKTSEQEPPKKTGSIRDEFDQGGEYESTPVKNPDVVRETDHFGEELPEVGTAKNLLNKFKSIQEEKAANVASQRRQSPPKEVGKVEYTNEPTQRHEQYVGKSEEGEFESQPKQHADVVRSGDRNEDVIPEKGSAKNIMNKFKEIQSGSGEVRSPERREITPDRSGKVEYVSEPRGEHIVYEEAKGDSGVFESTPKVEEGVVRSGDAGEEVLPQAGSAKTLLNKFKQYESEAANRPPPSPKREITPDKSGKVEYVSEPRGFLEKYEPQCESGVYENQPNVKAEVVRSGERSEEYVPEAGTAKKTLERFKEIQTHGSSSTHSSKPRQSFTPPRELSPGRSVSGVSENQPQVRPDVVRSGEAVHEDLPEQGTAKNILNKFREIQSGSASPVSPQRKPKEFTPPPESGVYENKPTEHIKVENDQQTFSGILENTPTKSAADVPASREPLSPEQELPESGLARNLVSKFRQLETSSNTSKSASPKFKEFTPPRDSRGPLSPKSPAGATTNGVHPSDLPGQYQQQEQAAIYENEPETKSDVYREADTDWNEGLPKPNTTASMLERFKTMQQKAAEDQKTPSPISRKDDPFTNHVSHDQENEAKNVQYE